MITINKNNTHYTLEGNTNCLYLNELFISLIDTNLLSSAFIGNNQLHFHAQSVILLDDFLLNKTINYGYEDALFTMYSLSKQIISLENMGLTFYAFGPKDIIVVNNTYFFLLNTNKLFLIENNNLTFLTPISKPYFASPELLNIHTLPSSISFKSIYYSLGVLIIQCLFNNYILKGNEIKSDEEIDAIIKPIKETKLYWCLKRCLEIDTNDRYLLFI